MKKFSLFFLSFILGIIIMDESIAINDGGALNIPIMENNYLFVDSKEHGKIDFEQELEREEIVIKNINLDDIEQVKNTILKMYELDQEVRHAYIKNLNNIKPEIIVKVDEFHTEIMKKILQKYGWITISKFGKEADKQAWLLVQHADNDPFFQAGCLFILSNLIEKRETDKQNYAYLYDRVAANFHQIGLLQKYGTQVDIKGADIKLQPYEGSLKDVDKHRSEVGLESLNDYLQKIEKVYKP